jgi:Domain of unknown function (DUF1839)
MSITAGGAVTTVFSRVAPQQYQPHRLHGADRAWPETNCYVDLWIELLSAYGTTPEAMLGFTVTQDYEGDQFTFFKVPLEDLESLYGIVVTELALYDSVEAHVATQIDRGRLCLVEMDSFFLPDTAGTTYRTEHGKTTVGINRIDPDAASMDYFHNGGFFELSGEDYAGVFQHGVAPGLRWIPYTEFAKFPATPVPAEQLRDTARQLLRHHLKRRPASNPLAAYAAVFAGQVEQVAERGMDFFHLYAFNTVRQFGANFELLASHLEWLDAAEFSEEIVAARQISDTAKTTQFMLARAVARHRFAPLETALEPTVTAWNTLMAGLDDKVG